MTDFKLKPDKLKKRKKTLFFVALPYVTAELHTGRIMGTFLPADIIKRYYEKFKNKRISILSGLDCYGTSVYKELIEKKLDKETFFIEKEKTFFKTLSKVGISFSPLFKTYSLPHYRYTNKHFFKLLQENKIFKKETPEKFCNNCKLVLADRFLETEEGESLESYQQQFLYRNSEYIEPPLKCVFCKTSPVIKTFNNLFLKYDNSSQWVEKYFVNQKEKQLSRSFLHWGLKGSKTMRDFNDGYFTYYVWVEALCSYPELYQRIEKNYDIEEIKYFYGKDNHYYHRVVYPELLTKESAKLAPTDENVFMRHHILDGESKKLSSSKKNFLKIEDFNIKNYDLLRFGLAYEDCLTSDSSITKEKIVENCNLYLRKFINTTNRLVSCLKKLDHLKRAPLIRSKKISCLDITSYVKYMDQSNLRCAIEQILFAHNKISQLIDEKVKTKTHKYVSLYEEFFNLLNFLEPFTPKTVIKLKSSLKKLKAVKFSKESFLLI